MINTQTLKGNLVNQDYSTAFTLSQGDKGVPFRVELLENGTPYTLQSTDIVTIEWLKPNGNPFLQEGNIKYGTNYIEFTTPESVAQYSGSGTFNIIITNNNVRKGTIRREYKVIPTSFKPGSISEDVITDAITELRNLNTELAETVQNNQDLINNNQAATKQDISNINSSLDYYVQKETGKGLSTNDFTTAYKTILDGLTTKINNAVLEGKKSLYPVNSIYLSLNSTNPADVFGFGTWVQIAQGRSLVGVDAEDEDFEYASKTGGSKTHNHASGDLVADIGAVDSNLGSIGYNATGATKNNYNRGITGSAIGNIDSKKANHATTVSGNTSNSSSLQPYYCIYIFKRTA